MSRIRPSVYEDLPSRTFDGTLLTTDQFEKILALGLPERSDRRDTLTLMSSYQNVKLEWMDAVKGEDIKQVAWPAVRLPQHLPNNTLNQSAALEYCKQDQQYGRAWLLEISRECNKEVGFWRFDTKRPLIWSSE